MFFPDEAKMGVKPIRQCAISSLAHHTAPPPPVPGIHTQSTAFTYRPRRSREHACQVKLVPRDDRLACRTLALGRMLAQTA